LCHPAPLNRYFEENEGATVFPLPALKAETENMAAENFSVASYAD
jgi:hypothetical protein